MTAPRPPGRPVHYLGHRVWLDLSPGPVIEAPRHSPLCTLDQLGWGVCDCEELVMWLGEPSDERGG